MDHAGFNDAATSALPAARTARPARQRARRRLAGADRLPEPDPDLLALLPPELCLELAAVPWATTRRGTLVAAADSAGFAAIAARLPLALHPLRFVPNDAGEVRAAIRTHARGAMRDAAETGLAEELSARSLAGLGRLRLLALAILLGTLGLLLLAPALFLAAAAGIAIASLIASSALKLAALAASFGARPPPGATGSPPGAPLPRIALLVPLHREAEILPALVSRLARLDYPARKLAILLVTEEGDAATRAALARTHLPATMRVVEVPRGTVATKPRALNYALNFTTADIVGVLDAEDAPEPDQLRRIAAHFARAGEEVICLQGILDYYNARASWMARAFAIEYAGWFRVVLPGLARLGLAIPLGGTTVYFRRRALARIGRWDAHNVTEDADLGIRLARFGYRTELVPTVTREEANDRLLPWIRQRSRWIKGYMMTWLVHMRRPARLWRDLGPWRFAGFQILFLGTLAQFLFAPVLWSFWAVAFGLGHPLSDLAGPMAFGALLAAFVLAEATNLAIGLAGICRSAHRGLEFWVPTLALYYPLASLAALKALGELVIAPFFWDKTRHGHSLGTAAREEGRPVRLLRPPGEGAS